MRVLLTGAAGFIGSHMARLLVQEGCEVYVLLRRESDPWRIKDLLTRLHVIEGNLLDPVQGWLECLEASCPELCFHFAWYTEPGVFLSSPLNLQYLSASLVMVIRLAAMGCRKLVIAGSFSEYDQELGYLSESSPLRPNTLYGAAKAALYQVLSSWASGAGVELLWPRIFSLYGPAEHPKRFVPAVILATLRGEATHLTPGEQMRDYLHVEDVVTAIWRAVQKGLRGPLNIGSGEPVALREIALLIGKILNRVELIRLGDLPYREGDPMFICANNRLLKQSTGWSPCYTLEEGLRHTIEWWRGYINHQR